MSQKNLFVFTLEFPFGTHETYMESEFKHWNKFDRVYVISLLVSQNSINSKRNLPPNVEVIPVMNNHKAYIKNCWKTLFDVNLYSELLYLIRTRRLSLLSVKQLVSFLSRAHYDARNAIRQLKEKAADFNSGAVFYSYRFEYQPYVAYLVSKEFQQASVIVSRAHRYDLYENSNASNYIPMRRFLLKAIKCCFPCSEHGTNYLQKCFPKYADKIKTSYLGTVDHGVARLSRSVPFRIVSCSNIVPVKRLSLLIDALACIRDYAIEWTHFGDGELAEEMRQKACKDLQSNVSVIWKGQTENKVVLKELKSGKYNLFISVSNSEGLPVSIMEACSFGIPCLATNAGGTGEILVDGINGRLLPVNTNAQEISSNISYFINLSDDEYSSMCRNARSIWEKQFSAENNYKRFVDHLYHI